MSLDLKFKNLKTPRRMKEEVIGPGVLIMIVKNVWIRMPYENFKWLCTFKTKKFATGNVR